MIRSPRQTQGIAGCLLLAAAVLMGGPLAPLAAQGVTLEDSAGQNDPAWVSAVSIDATILGGQARTRMELTVSNTSSRVRGGNLVVPLPKDALVMGYQLDVNGVLVDGVPVEKPRATEVYETIERRGTDPGLVEQAQGNMFRTRVFPVQPGQSRRVVIMWSSNLSGPAADLYTLPLGFSRPLNQFDLKLSVLDIKTPPKLQVSGLEGCTFTAWDSGFQSSVSRRNIQLDTVLELRLPSSGLGKVLVEETERERWFSVLLPFKAASAAQAPRAAWTKARSPLITLYLDASWSRKTSDPGILPALLAQTATLVGSPIQIELVVFRNSPEPVRKIKVSPGDAREIKGVLDQIAFDGGSRFDNLPPPAKDSLVLYMTDAVPTLGEQLPHWNAPETAVLVGGTAVDNGSALRLAGLTGQVISVDGITSDKQERISSMAQSLVTRTSAPVAQLVSGQAKDIHIIRVAGNESILCLSGQLVSSTAELAWGTGSADQKLAISDESLRQGTLARFAWAQAQLQDFMMEGDYGTPAWKTRLSQFGTTFGIVTPGTSLLVLESLDQYLEFDIKPPSSLPQWENAWRQQASTRKKDEAAALESRIQNLASQWNERVDWWKRDFSKVPDKIPPTPAPKGRSGNNESAMDIMAESAPAPAMARPQAVVPMGAAPGQALRDEAEESKKMSREKADGEGDDMAIPPAGREAQVEIQAWNPDRPYLKELGSVGPNYAYARYLKIRDSYSASPAFFLEVGDWFARNKMPDLAWRIWTTIADLGFRDTPMLRILANRLAQAGDLDLARILFELIRDDRPFEPQSHRDLALVLARMGRLPEAVPLLYDVATGDWKRTRGIEIVSLMEFNRYLIPALKQGLSPLKFDKRLVRMLDCDLRIVLSWDADSTDQDLWITEPSGFRVSYAAKDSPHGGHISNDITDGYGPEEYLIRTARAGSYRIETNFFGSRSPELTGAVTLFATIFTNYGRSNEKSQTITLQLEGSGDSFLVGTATWEK